MSLLYLLDTNIVSEPLKPRPDPQVMAQLDRAEGRMAVASVVWHELVYGVCRLPRSRRRSYVERYLEEVIAPSFVTVPYDEAAADWHGREQARLERLGRTPGFADGQIASIAATRGLTLVTGNTRHFADFRDLSVKTWFSLRP